MRKSRHRIACHLCNVSPLPLARGQGLFSAGVDNVWSSYLDAKLHTHVGGEDDDVLEPQAAHQRVLERTLLS